MAIKGVGKVSVPHPAAFFFHKLLVAAVRREPGKREKDYRQVAAVAKALAMDEAMLAKAKELYGQLPQTWRKRITLSLSKGLDFLGEAISPAKELWDVLAQ